MSILRQLIAIIALFALATSASGQSASIMGFAPKSAAAQQALEKRFDALISAESARTFHRYFTSEPHPAGTEQNKKVAEYIADTWKKQGLEDVVIRQYDVLSSLPKEVSLEMVSPKPFKASLREDAYDVDPDSKNPALRGAWLSMSASGEVTAPVVYAHSGNPEDYEVLRKAGIDVKGKIVLVRYSNPYSYRGFKALTAQRMGAVGILIYSDPAETGFKRGEVFPNGPWGPESYIQRGAITYDFIVPGDPLTPGWASLPGAKRIDVSQAQSLPKIMAIPLSWRDAKPLLDNMGGPQAPKDWQGGLPITYRFGGEARVHMKVDLDTRVMPYYNVEARIHGSEHPEQFVVLGNHHDAWEYGGVDPSSGTASMMEMTRAFGQLFKDGVRPRRTLVFCSWDGEEVGLTGSTEWGEQFESDLRKNAIAYINVDSSASGPNFSGSAVGSLAPMLLELTRGLTDPATGASLHDAWLKYETKERAQDKSATPVTDANLVDVRIGSGSDHTVFLNFDGVSVIGLQFDGPYGVYHSAYDDFYWMNHFGDPGYKYHALMSQLWADAALRLANADVFPFDVENYARNIREFVLEVQKKPGATENVDLKPLLESIASLASAGVTLNASIAATLKSANTSGVNQLNSGLLQVERNWLLPDGIPGRPWFKHSLYAARYTYAHLELPGLTEAVEKGDWATAKAQGKLLQDAVAKNTALLISLNATIQAKAPTQAAMH